MDQAIRSKAFGLPFSYVWLAAAIWRIPCARLRAQQQCNKRLLRFLRGRASDRQTMGDNTMECDELTGPRDIPEDFDDDKPDEDEDEQQNDLDFTGK